MWIIVFSAGLSSEPLSSQLSFVQLQSFGSVEFTDAGSVARGGEEGGLRAPGRGGGGAPPSAVTGAGCICQSAPSRPGCGGRPSARAAQSVASPLPAKNPSSARASKLQNRPRFPPFCLDPFY